MLGDLAMDSDEEFPELSEDKGDNLECDCIPAAPLIRARPPVHSPNAATTESSCGVFNR